MPNRFIHQEINKRMPILSTLKEELWRICFKTKLQRVVSSLSRHLCSYERKEIKQGIVFERAGKGFSRD